MKISSSILRGVVVSVDGEEREGMNVLCETKLAWLHLLEEVPIDLDAIEDR